MIQVALMGTGRMGRQVAEVLAQRDDATLSAMVSRDRPDWGDDIHWAPELGDLADSVGLLIDFSLPGGTRDAAKWCRANLVPLVSGTTGLGAEEMEALRRTADLAPVLWAPNLSRGVNILLRNVIETAAALPGDTPVEIVDVHHVHKKDAPSGTALALARAIAAARGADPEDCISAGESPRRRDAGMIHCVSVREGEVIGDHRVTFFHAGERIELAHSARHRDVFAAGAVAAGLWLVTQPAGLYSANDWLGH